jgi:hypothetical protein
MITAQQAKELSIEAFHQDLEAIELEIKAAATRGSICIKLGEKYLTRSLTLARILREFGYNVQLLGEVTEISWL